MHQSGHELNSVAGDEKRLTVCEPDDLLARDACAALFRLRIARV